MTVAITFALTDGGILMTDGRRTNLQDDSIVTDARGKDSWPDSIDISRHLRIGTNYSIRSGGIAAVLAA